MKIALLKINFLVAVQLLLLVSCGVVQASNPLQPCGNGQKLTGKGKNPSNPDKGDPLTVYCGNEYREITDLQVWGGVGDHQLTWERWGNSRFVGGPAYFGTGHSWRHSYQWDMATAGTSGTGLPQMEIIYPDGSDIIFIRDSATATTWHAATNYGINDVLSSSGSDFYLQKQNGWVYHFQAHTDGSGNVYYLMSDFKDTKQNDYTLTYNGANQLTQVTEPGGRYLQINYTNVSINKVDFTTFARVAAIPPNNVYTQLNVTDPTPYRYLRYLSADGGNCMVSEVQFYDIHGNLLTGTPFGTGPSQGGCDYTQAFDGNTSTFSDQIQTSGGYVGIDLGPGNTAVVGKVLFCPRSGHGSSMYVDGGVFASSAGQFQGSNQAASSVTVIQSVTTSDGRTVTYNYTPFDDATLPYVYQTLSSVSYEDGTQATYIYGQVFQTTHPLVSAFVDPRYPLPFAKAKSAYFGVIGSALGEVQNQINYDTGETLNTISYGPSAHFPTITDGNGGRNMYSMSTGQNVQTTDPVGGVTTYAYDSKGFINSAKNARGYTTTKVNTPFEHPTSLTHPDGSVRNWVRDSLDLPTSFKDELSHTTSFTRDTNHRVTNISYPDASTEAFTYNSFGQMLTHTQRNGGTSSAAYDSTGLITSSTNALSQSSTYTHDSFGRLASVTDARGNTTSYQYNSRGLLTQITYPDSSTYTYTYDTFGDKTSETNEIGKTWTYTYDTFKRPLTETDPLSRTTTYVYRSGYFFQKPDQVILPSGKVTANTYDLKQNLISQTVGYGTSDAATTHWVYDADNNVTSSTDPNGHVWTYTYDNRDRKLSQTDPLGHTTSYTYDAANNVLTVTRPDGGVTHNTYDTMHRLLTTTDPKGEVTTNTYDASGNLLTTKDPRSNTYTYTYDSLNRKTRLTYPDGSYEAYGYDPVGNLVSYTTRAGQTKTSVFDNRNREVSFTWSDSTPGVTRTYDAAGRLLSSANGTSTSTYSYDNANQLLSETQANASAGASWVVSYAYDADGNRTTLTYPSGTVVTYGYTNRNQTNAISVGATSLAGYTYDGNGNVVSKTLSDGTLASYTYDAANRLTTLNHTLSGTSFARFDYGYDSVNRRTYEQRDTAAGDVFGYDAVDQVTSVNYDATNPTSGTTGADRTVGYTYDASGNRTAVNDNVNGNASYSANNLNEYTSVGGASYASDANGNLITGNGLYIYDAQNRLDYGQVGTNIDQFAYDSKNRVVERTVNGTPLYLVYDGWDLIEERDATNTVLNTYVHGVRQDEILTKTNSSGTVYYHHNALGSVTDLTNSSGVVVEKYKYDVYGKPAFYNGSGTAITASAYGNRFLFTGREFMSEVNLYDYRNRVYSADLGRFLQTDPVRFSAGDVNIYRYVGNNPFNGVDPYGTSPVGYVSGALGGGAVGNALTDATFDSAVVAGAEWGAGAGEAVEPVGGGIPGAVIGGVAAGIADVTVCTLVGALTGDLIKNIVDDIITPPAPEPAPNPTPAPTPPVPGYGPTGETPTTTTDPANNNNTGDPYSGGGGHRYIPPPPPSQVTNCYRNGGPDWAGGDGGEDDSGFSGGDGSEDA